MDDDLSHPTYTQSKSTSKLAKKRKKSKSILAKDLFSHCSFFWFFSLSHPKKKKTIGSQMVGQDQTPSTPHDPRIESKKGK